MSNHEETQQNPFDFTLKGGSGIYTIYWENLNISAQVDRFKETSDYDVKAEVKIISSRVTSAGHLRTARFPLTSSTSRNAFAKSLHARDADVDWDTIIEQMCVAVLDEYRSGNPPVVLDGNIDVEANIKWVIDPIIQQNNPTLIYGQGSAGKSWFGQFLAVMADEGTSKCGLNVEPSKVLYLDWETDERELNSRVTMIRRGMKMEGGCKILYKRMSQGLSQDIETIRKMCIQNDITLVVCDSLGSACMGEPESAEVVLRTFSALRSLDVSSLVIDHTNKEGHLFGSVYKFNQARQIFHVKKSQSEDDNKIVIGLFHQKANNSPLMKPIGFTLTFSDGGVNVERQDVRDTELEVHLNMKDRIQNILRNKQNGMSITEIADELDKTETHIRNVISKSIATYGTFIKLDNGNYANRALQVEEGDIPWRVY
jgi:hypothetical protein